MKNGNSRRAQKETLLGQMIEVMEHLYDRLDSGNSFEEIEIMIDILAAGGRARRGLDEWSHTALNIIRFAREEKVSRTEVMTYVRKLAKAIERNPEARLSTIEDVDLRNPDDS